MNERGFAPIALIVIAVIALIGVGAWYSATHQPAHQPVTGNAVATSAPQSPEKASQPPLGMLTYRDPVFGFQFNYASSSDLSVGFLGGRLNSMRQRGSGYTIYPTAQDFFLPNEQAAAAYFASSTLVKTENINGNTWSVYKNISGGYPFGYEAFKNGVMALIITPDIIPGPAEGPFSAVFDSFQFASSTATRVDTLFGNLKEGDVVNGLPIASVVRTPGDGYPGYDVTVAFQGEITLSGYFTNSCAEDLSCMAKISNLDAPSIARLPIIATSSYLDYLRQEGIWIAFNNQSAAFLAIGDNGSTTVSVDNIKETLRADGRLELSADFVKVVPR